MGNNLGYDKDTSKQLSTGTQGVIGNANLIFEKKMIKVKRDAGWTDKTKGLTLPKSSALPSVFCWALGKEAFDEFFQGTLQSARFQ
jgi:hypothetical protein